MKNILIATIAAVVLVGCGNPEADRALLDAAEKGNIKAVKQHLAAGADLNAKNDKLAYKGMTPLLWAVSSGHKEIVELLIAKGSNVKARCGNRGTPLYCAAAHGHKEIAELLIAKGADVNRRMSRGWTALHIAAHEAQEEVAELLIANGADMNAKIEGDNGYTPLHFAVNFDHKEIAELLIAKGADVNAKIEGGGTPLHDAAVRGHTEFVELLIAKGADVNAKADNGETPLHFAATKEVAELLIAKGAGVNAQASGVLKGQTPLDFAIDYAEDEKIAELLRKHGGKTKKKLKAVIKSNELESDVPELGLKKDKSKFYYDMAAIKGNGANWPVTKNSRVLRKNYSDLNDAQFIDKLFSMMEKSEGKIHAFVLAHKDRTQKEINYATAKALNHPYEKSTSSTGQQVYTTSEYLFEAESFSKLIPKKFNLPSSAKHEAKTAEELKAEGK